MSKHRGAVQIADPFLGLMRDVFWKKGTPLPTINEGIFVVLWTLKHTIQLNPGGINGPEQVAVLTKSGNKFEAKILSDAEKQEHFDNVNGVLLHLKKYKEIMQGKSEKEIPKMT